jgi:hypothetical protein
MALEHI